MNSNANDRRKSVSIAAVVACALVLAVGLSGCTASKSDPTPTATVKPTPVPATVAWKSKEILVSDVELIGDVAIAYRRQGPQLEIIARNVKNGKQLWKDEALGAADSLGLDLDIELLEHDGRNFVAYTGTKTGAYGWLTIADISTGEQIKIGKNFEFWGKRPFACGKTFCTEGSKVRNGQLLERHHFKFNWSSKQWQVVPTRELEYGLQRGGQLLALGLSSYWDEEVEMLSYSNGSEDLWKRPYEEVFGKGYASSAGWAWTAVGEDDEILLGYGLHAQDDFFESDKKSATYKLADLSKLVAVDAKSGKVLWRQNGASSMCGLTSEQGSAAPEDTIVLCYYTAGQRKLTDKGNGYYSRSTKGAVWSVAAFDASTGVQKWKHNLSDVYKYDERLNDAGMPITEDPISILPLVGGDKAVHSLDGTVMPLEEAVGKNVLCTVDREEYFVYSATLGTEAPAESKAAGDSRFDDAQMVCKRGSWKPTKAVPDVDEFRRAGYKSEDVVVLSQLEGMVAYRLAAPTGNKRKFCARRTGEYA